MTTYEYRAMWDDGEERTEWMEIDPVTTPGHWLFCIAQDPDTYVERRPVGKAERVMFKVRGDIGTPYDEIVDRD